MGRADHRHRDRRAADRTRAHVAGDLRPGAVRRSRADARRGGHRRGPRRRGDPRLAHRRRGRARPSRPARARHRADVLVAGDAVRHEARRAARPRPVLDRHPDDHRRDRVPRRRDRDRRDGHLRSRGGLGDQLVRRHLPHRHGRPRRVPHLCLASHCGADRTDRDVCLRQPGGGRVPRLAHPGRAAHDPDRRRLGRDRGRRRAHRDGPKPREPGCAGRRGAVTETGVASSPETGMGPAPGPREAPARHDSLAPVSGPSPLP